MKEFEELIEALEVVKGAIEDRDEEKGFEAITVFLLMFTDLFADSPEIIDKSFPVLEELKDAIREHDYNKAYGTTLGLLAKFRSITGAAGS